jgi:hypothetical protein
MKTLTDVAPRCTPSTRLFSSVSERTGRNTGDQVEDRHLPQREKE